MIKILMNICFWSSLYNTIIRKLSALSYVAVISLFIGLVVSSPITYFIPSIRPLVLAILMIFSFLYFFDLYFKNRGFFLFQFLIVSFGAIQYSLNQIRTYDADLAPLIAMFIASLFINHVNQILKLLKIVIIVNLLVMLYEFFSFQYVINIVVENRYEFGRMQGLFSYSKEAGYFIVMAFLFVRFFDNSFIFKIILFLSAVLSGSRTPIIFIAIIMFIDYIYLVHRHINIKKLIKKYLYVIIILFVFISLGAFYFTDKNEYMLLRILSSFDFESSSQQARLFFWSEYVYHIGNYNFFQLLFGDGTYINNVIGNGSESSYLMILSQMGLIGLLLFVIPLFVITILFFKYPFTFYPLIIMMLFLQVGRISMGWADGILMWVLIFFILNKYYVLHENKRRVSFE